MAIPKNTPKKAARPAASLASATKAIAYAEKLCADLGERMTPARRNAYAELLAQHRPVSAYELLGLMEDREQRKLAPLTVYRLLDFLMKVGLVHRLASAQAFMACDHPEHPHEVLYLVCSTCGSADELAFDSLLPILQSAAKSRGFNASKHIVEVQGICRACSAVKSN